MDSWEDLHLPVLRAAVECFDKTGQVVRWTDISAATGLSENEVLRALRALEHEQPPFFSDTDGSAEHGILLVGAPTGHARRTVGQWPTPETLADKIIAGLSEAAEREADPEKQGWLRKTAAWLGGTGRDVAVNVAATAISRSAGM